MNSWSISHEDLDHIDLDADFEHFTKQLRRGGSQDPSSEDLAITGKVYITFPFTLVDVLSWGVYGLSWVNFEALIVDAISYKLLTTTTGPKITTMRRQFC